MFLDETLQVKKFDNADFKYDISFLKFSSKYRITVILVPSLSYSCSLKIPKEDKFGSKFKNVFLQEILQFDNLNGEVKHDNNFFKF